MRGTVHWPSVSPRTRTSLPTLPRTRSPDGRSPTPDSASPRWLQHNAADSHAALRSGVSPTIITDLEHHLGIQVPADLRTL
ncbi:hypothetical protein [Streptomyces sp. NPDC057582]|uniref:hypothetical protein n=1 Tax=Streptomyces sp. NPDC057582 TaxID=3346174 RepID=UPI00368A5846